MSAIKERQFFQKKDYGFKFSWITGNKFMHHLLSSALSAFFFLFRLTKRNKTKRIVIVSLMRLGDTVFTVPGVKIILNCYSDFDITIVCYPDSEAIYRIAFQDIKIVVISKEEFKVGRRFASFKARRIFNKLKPEIIFDLTGTVSSATLIFNSSARKIVGHNEDFFKAVYTHFKHPRTKPHLMDSYLDIVMLSEKFERTPDLYEFPYAANPCGKITIHPFAIREAKEWNLKKYIQLANVLKENYAVKIIAPEGYVNKEAQKEIEKIQVEFKITYNINELINELKDCSVFISNDSGPIYIASLLGKPTFTIYGPTNPAYSLPFGKHHSFYNKILECSPLVEISCHALAGINCPHHNCLNFIAIDEVYVQVKEFLNKLGIKHSITNAAGN